MGLGVTRNVGREGAFIETNSAPPLASAVRVELTFGSGSPARFRGAGNVRHVERKSGSPGFGAWVVLRTGALDGTS
jgi:hypothetical protein